MVHLGSFHGGAWFFDAMRWCDFSGCFGCTSWKNYGLFQTFLKHNIDQTKHHGRIAEIIVYSNNTKQISVWRMVIWYPGWKNDLAIWLPCSSSLQVPPIFQLYLSLFCMSVKSLHLNLWNQFFFVLLKENSWKRIIIIQQDDWLIHNMVHLNNWSSSDKIFFLADNETRKRRSILSLSRILIPRHATQRSAEQD